MAFRFEHHGTWTPTRVWHHSCCLFETYDVLQASQRTLQCSQLSHHFLRRRRAWFAAGIWDWLADSFRPRIPGGLQLCCMESAEVECWGQAWEGPKFPLLHFQLSPWQLWIHHSPSLPRLGLCSVHRRGDQLATSTDRFGKYCPGRLYCCAGIATSLRPWKAPAINLADTVLSASLLILASRSLQEDGDMEAKLGEHFTVIILMFRVFFGGK